MASSSTVSKQAWDQPVYALEEGTQGQPMYPPVGTLGEAQGSPSKMTGKRRLIILLGTVVAVVCLVIALGVGLGVGLHHHKPKSIAYAYGLPGGATDVVPAGQNDDHEGMLESGSYTTLYTNTSSAFAWNSANVRWQSGNAAAADIVIRTDQRNTAIDGFGAALTDASASLLMQIKETNTTIYQRTMHALFNQRSGLNILRIPIGASDYSLPDDIYTFADKSGSSSDPLSKFNDKGAEQYIYPILRDALSYNPNLKISIVPWSPPSWMKANDAITGGSLSNGMTYTLAEYLAKSVQAFEKAVQVKPWGLAVQNEPFNSMPYPSMTMTPALQSQLLAILRGRLGELGYGDTHLWGLDDDFVHWEAAEQLVKTNISSLDGISWHCYNGSWNTVQQLRKAIGDKGSQLRMSMTECSGQDTGVQPDVSSFRWWGQNIFFPMLSHNFSSILVWNLALDAEFGPHLSSTVCQNCKGAIEVTARSVQPSLQSVMLQHMAVASSDLTRFGGGPASSLNATAAQGKSCAHALAFSAPWNSSATRYGLVVENTCSNQTDTMSVGLNGHTTELTFAPGWTSYVWTM